jgi:tetratricopeptide (TPR) repeat protein
MKKTIITIVIILVIVGALFAIEKATRVPDHLEQATTLFNQNDFEKAIAETNVRISLNSKDIDALIMLASIYNQQGSVEGREVEMGPKVITIADQILALDANNAEAYRLKGYAYEILQDYKNSIPAYDKAIALDPKNALTFSNRGHAYGLMGEMTKAQSDYRQALVLNPNLDAAMINLAKIYLNDKKTDEAVVLLKKAIGATQNLRLKASAEQILGVVYILGNDFKMAKSYEEAAIKDDPSLATAYVELARARFLLISSISDPAGFQNEVINIFNLISTANKINPNLTSALSLGGLVLQTFDNKVSAKEMYEKALLIVDKDITLSAAEKIETKKNITNQLNLLKNEK